MSTTTRQETTPLAVRPLRDLPPGRQRIGATDDGTSDIYGHCASFCNVMGTFPQNGGATVDEHMAFWCEHHILTTDVQMADGTVTNVGVQIVPRTFTARTATRTSTGRDGIHSSV